MRLLGTVHDGTWKLKDSSLLTDNMSIVKFNLSNTHPHLAVAIGNSVLLTYNYILWIQDCCPRSSPADSPYMDLPETIEVVDP